MRSFSLKWMGRVVGVLAAICAGTACTSKAAGNRSTGAGGPFGTGGTATGGVFAAGRTANSGGIVGSGGVAGGGSSGSGGTTAQPGTGGRTAAGSTVVTETGGIGTGGTGAGGVGTGSVVAGGSGAGGSLARSQSFTETVGSVSFDMVYVPAGTFTLGCESPSCPADTAPVSGVKVSSFHIGKAEVTNALWAAVMGDGSGGAGSSVTNITWYDALAFACELTKKTGRKYRMMTEAEFEYAAKNHLSSLENVGSGEEWAYNSWSATHVGGTDPVGANPGKHMQKTRRDPQGTVDNITGRLIRSIDGVGPALRLAISAEMDFPPGYVPPCEVSIVCCRYPVNSYRDPQWLTGSDEQWTAGTIAIGKFDLRVWEDGTARLNDKDGQWFTSNDIAFVFVPSSGPLVKFPYIFIDQTHAALISDASFTSGGFVGRIEKKSENNLAKPAISGLKSGAELAAAAGEDYTMVDMVAIPEAARKQDPRLLDGTDQCWFQDNSNAGGLHHYRQDVDPDELRFTLNEGQVTMLANGKWFTVNNTFLRIIHSTGYTADYLYAVTPDGYVVHESFQAYERGDFRMFQKRANNATFPLSCGSQCSSEIPKGQAASAYSKLDSGRSTFMPAPCPRDGCK